MEYKWSCQFKNPPDPITVGQKLLMLCEGDAKKAFQDSIRIEFLDKKLDYSLYVLKALNREEHFLALKVAPYRTGDFKAPFIITDGKESLMIEDFSFSVQSVLKESKQPAQPYGPYGPFKPPLPFWHLAALALSFGCLAGWLCILLNRLFKRKRYIQKILSRKNHLNPSKAFILGLRRLKIDSTSFAGDLERLFQAFLEDLFFIPAVGQTTDQIMKHLKKQYPAVYKKEGPSLRQTLNELSSPALDKKASFALKKVCQNMVFLLDDKKGET